MGPGFKRGLSQGVRLQRPAVTTAGVDDRALLFHEHVLVHEHLFVHTRFVMHKPGPAERRAMCTACSCLQVGRDSAVAAKIFEKGLDEPRLLREPDYVLQVRQSNHEAGGWCGRCSEPSATVSSVEGLDETRLLQEPDYVLRVRTLHGGGWRGRSVGRDRATVSSVKGLDEPQLVRESDYVLHVRGQ